MNAPNRISESAQLIGDVKIGYGNFISPGANIIGPISIGNDNYFGPNCVVGAPPQDDVFDIKDHCSASMGNRNSEHEVIIGNKNIIREFVTIHQGLTSKTIIRDNCYLMAYSHVAHDCYIDENVKIANNVQMGGFTTIFHNSYIGLSAVLHQFTTIGAFVMIGMGSVVSKNIPPGVLALGTPARILKINRIALERAGLNDSDWETEYLKSPTLEYIHENLQDDYRKFELARGKKLTEREKVAAFRSKKY